MQAHRPMTLTDPNPLPAVQIAAQWIPQLVLVLLVMASGTCWVYRCWWARCQDAHQRDARLITVLPGPSADAAGAHALWSHLSGLQPPWFKRLLFGTPHLSWEILMSQQETRIQVWVPGTIPPGLVEHALQAAWPGTRTRTDTPTHPLAGSEPDEGQQQLAVGGTLRLARAEAVPIRTRFEDNDDPLRAILAAGTELAADETLCVQLLARPVAGRARTGTGEPAASATLASRVVSEVLDLLTPGPTSTRASTSPPQRRGEAERDRLETSARNRAMVDKRHHTCWHTHLRYVATTRVPTPAGPQRHEAAQARLRARAHALASGFASLAGHNAYRRRRLRHPLWTIEQRRLSRGDLLSVPELATLAHLPTAGSTNLERAGAPALPAPSAVATTGAGVKPLGHSDLQPIRPIGLRVADARHHLHVLGATGSGKSTLLARMILDDVEQGRGTILLDPKGDLVTDLLDRLPTRAAERLVLIDADQPHDVPCLNPLHGADTDLVVDNLTSIFARVYSGFWGPRTDDLFRAACLTLRAQASVSTLADLPRLLTEPAFRARLVSGLSQPTLNGFWQWYEQLSDASRSQLISPLMNKLRAFLLRPFVHRTLAAGESTVDLTRVLDGGVCLVRIPKGSLGDDTTRLLGSLLVAQVWQATTARAGLEPPQRRDASLILDECQNFLHLPFGLEDLLAEARGFRLSLTLAHQHLGQLDRGLREGIATNARNKVFFTASPTDARELARHTQPRLGEYDLTHLHAFHAAARLTAHSGETDACTLATEPLPEPIAGRATHLRQHATHRHDAPSTPAASTSGQQTAESACPDDAATPASHPSEMDRTTTRRIVDPRR